MIRRELTILATSAVAYSVVLIIAAIVGGLIP